MTESATSALSRDANRTVWSARDGVITRIRRAAAVLWLAFAVFILALAAALAGTWLTRPGIGDQTPAAFAPLLLSALLLVPAARLILSRQDSHPAYAVLMVSLGISIASTYDLVSTRLLVLPWLVGLAFSGGALLHLAAVFPVESRLVRRFSFLRWMGYLIAVTLLLWSTLAASSVSSPEADLIVAFALGSGILFCLIALFHGFVGPSPVERTRAGLVAAATLLGLAPAVLVSILPPLRERGPSPYLVLPAALPCFVLGYAMQRFRIMGAAHWLRQAAVYGAISALILLAYGLVVTGLSLAFGDVMRATQPLWLGILALSVAFLFEPVQKRVQALADRTFFMGPRAYAETIRQFSSELVSAVNLETVAAVVRRVCESALEPNGLHFFIHDEATDQFAAQKDAGGRPSTDLRFARGPVTERLARGGAPIHIQLAALPPELMAERSRLTLLAASYFVPLVRAGELLGWIALGPSRSGLDYSMSQLALLEILGEQAAAAVARVQMVERLEHRLHDMNALTRVAQGVNITLTFDDVLELIYAQASQIIPLSHFYITLRAPQTGANYSAFVVEDNERVAARENVPLPDNLGLEREVLVRGRPVVTAEYESECRIAGMVPTSATIKAWMGVPLNAGAESIGVLSAGNRDPGLTYTPAQLALLQAIADQTAGAIVKARLLRETQERAAQLRRLNDVTRQLASTLEMEALRQVIADGGANVLDCEAAIFYVPDPSTGELLVKAASGTIQPSPVGQRGPIGMGTAFRAVATRLPAVENDVHVSSGSHFLDAFGNFPVRSTLAVPIQFQDALSGVLEVLNHRDGSPFGPEDETLLAALAAQAGVALENVRLYTLTDQELAARVEELSVMQRIDRELNASLEMDRAMRITLDWALRQSNAEAGLIGLLEADRLHILAEVGYGASPADASDQTLALTLPGFQAAVESAQPQRVRFEVQNAGGFLPESDHQIVIPIRREATVIGLLVLESTRASQEDLGFLGRLSDHAAIAISNAQLYDEVQRANIAKSDFVSLVAHELKNPMTSIKGYTELLAAGAVGPVNEMQGNFLNTIRSNTDRMSTLVSDLNDNSKIEAGRLRLDFKHVELPELVEETIRSMNRQLEEKQQVLTLELPDSLPPVWADRTRLTQIFVNLISNAHKYTPESGTLVVGAEAAENRWDAQGPGQVVHVWVRDSGIGISGEDQTRIFQKFFRSDDPKAREAPGAGLGLNITRSLVEMQGGRIWFESQYREGTTFHFTVPVAEV